MKIMSYQSLLNYCIQITNRLKRFSIIFNKRATFFFTITEVSVPRLKTGCGHVILALFWNTDDHNGLCITYFNMNNIIIINAPFQFAIFVRQFSRQFHLNLIQKYNLKNTWIKLLVTETSIC